MKKILSLGIAAGMLVSACAAYAYPTLAGPTGGLALPNAVVAPAGSFNVAADYDRTGKTGTEIGDTVPVRVVYGIAKGFELGADYGFQKLGDENGNNWGVNLKYATPLKVAGFALAAGGLYNKTKVDVLAENLTATEFYLVGGTVLPLAGKSVNLSLGANWTEGKAKIAGLEGKASGIRAAASVDAMLASNLCLGLEYQTAKKDLDAKPLSSIYARYAVTPMIAVQLGYTNAGLFNASDVTPAASGVVGANTLGTSKHHLVAGLNFVFGK
jgi:hypothetical protein